MKNSKTVLVTDYAWPSLDVERKILAGVGAELLVAETGEVDELVRLAPQADAILFNWKQVPSAVLRAANRCVAATRYGIGLDTPGSLLSQAAWQPPGGTFVWLLVVAIGVALLTGAGLVMAVASRARTHPV